MEILIIGSNDRLDEARQKFGGSHTYIQAANHEELERYLVEKDVLFDFTIDANPNRIQLYLDYAPVLGFLNTSTITLSQLGVTEPTLFGFCGMPTFLNREILEVSVSSQDHRPRLEEICDELKTPFQVVTDRVGMVTPRVICMIINEAYHTVEEGTATRDDIDKAMKLGTNYPFGPFEWCERIDIKNVHRLLEAIYDDTKDERYKVSPLLARDYRAGITPP